MNNEEHRKKKNGSEDSFTKKFLIILLSVVACIVLYMVCKAVSTGGVFPTNRYGVVAPRPSQEQTTEPAQTTTQEPSSEEETTEPPTEPDPELLAKELLEGMTTEEKVWQMMFVSPQKLYGDDDNALPVGGLYFSAEDLTDEAFRTQIATAQDAAAVKLLVGLTEEGGEYAPLYALGLTDSDTYSSEAAAYQLGQTLDELGFTFNLAPIADVPTYLYNSSVVDRAYSGDVNEASDIVAAVTKGLQSAGTAACLTHFPGLGSTAYDGLGREISYYTTDQYREADFLPFVAGIDAGAEMVLVSSLSPLGIMGDYTPCCMSTTFVTELLRAELGFEGVILSDDLSENVITSAYSAGGAAVEVVLAGCDVIFLSPDPEAAVEAILNAVEDGRISEEQLDESVYRILLLKARHGLIES